MSAAAPGFIHGAESLHLLPLPARYHASFRAAIADPEILSLKRQIALHKAREDELLARLDTGESGAAWAAAARAFLEMRQRYTEDGVMDGDELEAILDKGLADERAWREILDNAEARRRLADTERRRLETASAYMTADEIALVAGFLGALIKRHVRDREAVRALSIEMSEFFRDWRAPNRREKIENRETAHAENDSPNGGAAQAGIESAAHAIIDAEPIDDSDPGSREN